MNYTISIGKEIDFAPSSEVAEILQNVRTIISTRKGSVPLHRDFGISWEHLDKPMPVAIAMMQENVIEAIEDYEPRAKVVSVEFNEDEEESIEGRLNPVVVVSIGEEEEE